MEKIKHVALDSKTARLLKKAKGIINLKDHTSKHISDGYVVYVALSEYIGGRI